MNNQKENELKRLIKEEIEDRCNINDIITDVSIIQVYQQETPLLLIGIETLTHTMNGNHYNLEDYENDDALIEKIILDNLEALCSSIFDLGWESAKKNYKNW